jgi:hypothetical protein
MHGELKIVLCGWNRVRKELRESCNRLGHGEKSLEFILAAMGKQGRTLRRVL